MKKIALKNAARGTAFDYAGQSWILLENDDGRALCLSKDIIETRAFDEGNCNNFAVASSKEYLNGAYLDNLLEDVNGPNAFLTTELDLTTDDGLKDYGTCTVTIFLLTVDQYRRNRDVIPNADDWWWLSTAFSTKSNGYESLARCVNSDGTPDWNGACYGGIGLRPACYLDSDLLISVEDDEATDDVTPEHAGEIIAALAEQFGGTFATEDQLTTALSFMLGTLRATREKEARHEYHDMYAEKQSDELLLKLNDTRELWDSWNPKKGDTIAIEDGAAKTGKMFVESVVPESGIITLRAYSVPQSAKDTRSKSWEKVKFLQLAQEIAGRHGLTLETYGITDQTYDYVEQNNLADFAFFQNRCTLEGAAFLVYDGKLVVYDEAYMESQQPVDTITITPANDFEYRDEGTNAYGSAEAVNGGLTGTFAAPNGGDKVLRRILPFRMTDQSEADRFAKGLLRDANKNATVGTLWTGSLLRDYAAGSVVTLATEGVKSWDGTAFISRIRHDYVKTRSKLYLRKPLEGY